MQSLVRTFSRKKQRNCMGRKFQQIKVGKQDGEQVRNLKRLGKEK